MLRNPLGRESVSKLTLLMRKEKLQTGCVPAGTAGGKEAKVIEVTRLNETKLIVNADLIEKVEENPDTVITLSSGSKIIVKESRQEIRNLVILYKKEIFGRDL